MDMSWKQDHQDSVDNSQAGAVENLSQISVIVMAAGLSRRFGSNKLLAPFHGRPVVEWVFEALKTSGCAPELVTVVWHDPDVKAMAENYGFKTCFNPCPEEGQSVSIRVGLTEARVTGAYLFLTADQPLLKAATLSGMLKAYPLGKGRIMMAAFRGNAGNPVIFDRRYRAALMNLKGDTGGKQILQGHPEEILYYEVECSEELMDIDSALDLEALSQFHSSDSDSR